MPRRIWSGIRSLWRRPALKREIDEELRFHIEQRAADNIAAGMTPEEAAREARKRFGNMQSVREDCREARGANLGETVWQDIRFGGRMLLKNPGFTLIAMLTLGLGVGVSTAIYSVVNTVLLNPLPGAEANRLVGVGQRVYYNGAKEREFGGVTPPALALLLANQDLFADLAWYQHVDLERKTEDSLEDISGTIVSPNFFRIWGISPSLGRTFALDEAGPVNEAGIPERDAVIILSHSLWQSLLGGDPGVIGRTVELSGRHFTVVGVMPPYFQFPTGGYTKFWVPAEPVRLPPGWPASPSASVLGRLKPGVTMRQAQAKLEVVAERLEADAAPNRTFDQEQNRRKRMGFSVWPLASQFVDDDLRRTLFSLLGAIGFFLLISCANIANLTLARTELRRQELAVRAALGAGQRRLARQVLTESLLLAVLGGLAGLCLVPLVMRLLVSLISEYQSRLRPVHIDGQALGFALLVCLAAGVAFGLAPAFAAGRTRLSETLKQAGNSASAGVGRSRYRGKLVVLEVALTLVLLAGAGLMIQSVVRSLHVKPGFDPENLMYVKVFLPWERYEHEAGPNKSKGTSTDPLCDAVFSDMHDRVASLPGVKGVSFLAQIPGGAFQVEGQAAPVDLRCLACGVEDRDLFHVMRVPLLAGRYLERRDASDPAGGVLVNESMARLCWPGQKAVGKTFRRPSGASDPQVYEVVGVVGDQRERYDDQPELIFYVPYSPAAHWTRPRYFQAMFVRTQDNPAKLIPLVRKELKAVEPGVRTGNFTVVRQSLNEATQSLRTYMTYLVVFAGAALLLSAIGLYGVLSYSVARRTREIGIRMALGAERHSVLRLVLSEGARLVGGGVFLGLLAAFWLTRLLRSQLFEVSPTDPVVFGGVVLVLVAVALAACLAPALRAARVDPMQALRQD
jgi:putative ABC transport system permease protein